uniref:Uncharacterized protein n=1 Tax=Leptospira ellisii TaxID=2023197 RepID=A0A2N0B2V6_9LEPT|nr:hypothetical protein CH379_21970 [Leptospira ellisii]
MTITKKIRIDTLFRKYKWEEEPNDSKVFRHKFLSNLRAKIKDKETVFFSVNGNSYFLESDKESIEDTLKYIDTCWKAICEKAKSEGSIDLKRISQSVERLGEVA